MITHWGDTPMRNLKGPSSTISGKASAFNFAKRSETDLLPAHTFRHVHQAELGQLPPQASGKIFRVAWRCEQTVQLRSLFREIFGQVW
jgi:hypothetical protein